VTEVKTLNPSQASQRTKQIALLAIFSALYIVLRFIPFSMLIGGAGAYLSFSDFLAPIIGILLGPYLGGLTVLIGNFGAIGLGRPLTFPTLFGLGDFVPDFVAAVSTGFLMRRNWIPVVALNAGLLAVFFADPLTSIFVTIPGTSVSIPFAWMHIAAFAVLLSPLALKAAKWIESGSSKMAAGVAVMAFIGTMMQHLAGNILFEISFGQISPPIIPAAAWPAEWTAVMFAYPVERTILIVSAVLAGTPIILAVMKNHLIKIGKQEKITPPKQPITSS
jgi:riboflavin transporter FmnP